MTAWYERHRTFGRWTIDLALFALALFHGFAVLKEPNDLAYAVTLLGALGIFWRRELPVASLVIALPGLLFADAIVAPVAALFSLAVRYSDRRILVPAVLIVTFGYSAFWRNWESLSHATLLITYSVAVSCGALAVGILVRTRRDLAASLRSLEDARSMQIRQAENRARVQERARLAREMHDVVAHQVSLIAVQAGALAVTAEDPEAARAGSVIRGLAAKTIDELRQMLRVLRSAGAGPADLSPQVTVADIPPMVRGSGLNVELELDLPEDVPAPIQRAAYRTVQEGLTNVARYAPGSMVEVRCRVEGRMFVLSVENGPAKLPPLDLPTDRQGHAGLEERARLLGGRFDAGPTDGGGYAIAFEVMLDRSALPEVPVANGRAVG